MNDQQPPIEELDTDVLLELILQGCFTFSGTCYAQDFSSERRTGSWHSNS